MLRPLVLLAVLSGFVATHAVAAAASPREARTYDIERLDQRPIALTQVKPIFPPEMKRAGITGEVLVELIIDTEGNPRDCKVVKSSRPEFEASAITALSQWKFEPGIKHGRAVNTRLQVPIVYSLKNQQKKN